MSCNWFSSGFKWVINMAQVFYETRAIKVETTIEVRIPPFE